MKPQTRIFIDSIRKRIINGSNDTHRLTERLIADVNEYLAFIKIRDERITFLKNLLALKSLRMIDVFRNIEVSDFYDHVEYKIAQENIKNSNESDQLDLPALPECFIDISYLNILLKDPRIQDLLERIDEDNYKWKGAKNLLAGLAFRLMNKGKLIDEINTGQRLAKVFCTYFKKDFDPKDDRTFRPERAKTDYFLWIN